MLAVLAQRFDPAFLPGYEADFSIESLLVISNGLPMVLNKR